MKADEIREKARQAEGQLRKIPIPEWDAEVYFTPITVADQQYIKQKFNGKVEIDNLAVSIEMILYKALDEDGRRIWTTDEDRDFLRSVVGEKRITALIIGMTGADIDEAKKNSRKTRS